MNNLLTIAQVTVAGQDMGKVSTVRLDQRFDYHHNFEVRVAQEQLNIQSAGDLKGFADKAMGKPVIIKLRQLAGGVEKAVMTFSGIATGIQLDKTGNSDWSVVVTGVSPTAQLEAHRHTRAFVEKSLAEIADIVIGSLGNKKVSPSEQKKLPYVVQYHEDSYHFLQRLAEQYGEWFFYDGESLIFGKNARSKTQTAEVFYGSDFTSLQYNLHTVPVQFTGSYYHYEAHETFVVPSAAVGVSGLETITQSVMSNSQAAYKTSDIDISLQGHGTVGSMRRAVELKKSDLTNRMAVFSGSSKNVSLNVGSLVKVVDVKTLTAGIFKNEEIGTFLITRLSHSYDASGNYQNTFDAIPQKDPAFPPVDYNVVAPKAEPQPAVVKDTADPKAMGRVKVRFFWQPEPEVSPWIRVAGAMSHKDRGVYFVPEKDEIVFVDFEFSNPDLPYVTGTMYHGLNTPGPLFDKENNIKGIITRSGNHILINDKAGKEEISLYNKDKKNIIQLTLDGTQINIKSPQGKINLEAKEINMKAQTMNIDVQQTYQAQAQEMVMEAKANLKAKGQSGMKLETSGTLEAKGTQVQVEGQSQTSVKAGAQLALQGGAEASLKGAVVRIN